MLLFVLGCHYVTKRTKPFGCVLCLLLCVCCLAYIKVSFKYQTEKSENQVIQLASVDGAKNTHTVIAQWNLLEWNAMRFRLIWIYYYGFNLYLLFNSFCFPIVSSTYCSACNLFVGHDENLGTLLEWQMKYWSANIIFYHNPSDLAAFKLQNLC